MTNPSNQPLPRGMQAPGRPQIERNDPIDPQSSTSADDNPYRTAPEDQPGEPGAEGGSQSDATDKLPGAPSDDDSPLGDTDQHSSG
jgi:hypothetical protein